VEKSVAASSTAKKKPKSRVMLVDDHPLLRQGIAELVNSEGDLEVCGEAGNMQDAFTLAGKLKPDLIIIDVSLNGNNGIELMKNLSSRYATIPLLAYSMHDESIYAERALRAGAKGYVMKQANPEVLLSAIQQVLKGKTYLSDQMSEHLLGKLVGAGASAAPVKSPIEKLSDRELEVVQLMGRGLGTSQIADKLCLSVKTIETYREHLKLKLNLTSGQELLRYAIEWSLAQS
jgi:DNA-binding NarL/FixJ family response regulator